MFERKLLSVVKSAPANFSDIEALGDDDLMLLAGGSSGETRNAFTVLIGRHGMRLTQFCAKLVGDRRVGEELAQETWVRVWQTRARYQSDGKFPVLLFTIARNLCKNSFRNARRKPIEEASIDPEGVLSSAPDHLSTLLEEEGRNKVREALSRLPEKYREALLLRFSEGLDYGDMARVLDRSESTLRSIVHHGIQKLRAEIGGGQ